MHNITAVRAMHCECQNNNHTWGGGILLCRTTCTLVHSKFAHTKYDLGRGYSSMNFLRSMNVIKIHKQEQEKMRHIGTQLQLIHHHQTSVPKSVVAKLEHKRLQTGTLIASAAFSLATSPTGSPLLPQRRKKRFWYKTLLEMRMPVPLV